MSYKFLIIFIFVYVLQFGILKKIYLFDKGDFKIAKWINILISVFIFWQITSDSNGFFTMFTDYDTFKDNIYIKTGMISPSVNFIAKVVSNLLAIVLFVTAFNPAGAVLQTVPCPQGQRISAFSKQDQVADSTFGSAKVRVK